MNHSPAKLYYSQMNVQTLRLYPHHYGEGGQIEAVPKVPCKPHYSNSHSEMVVCEWGEPHYGVIQDLFWKNCFQNPFSCKRFLMGHEISFHEAVTEVLNKSHYGNYHLQVRQNPITVADDSGLWEIILFITFKGENFCSQNDWNFLSSSFPIW